jgi:site-specific recombinase XerC
VSCAVENIGLWHLCETLFFPRKLEIGPDTRRQYRYALNDWGRCLGHPPTLIDLDDDALLIWMRSLMDRREPRPLSAWTINERVGRVRTLWTWLAKRGIVNTFPTCRRLPAPDPTPRAWTKEELARLFAAADLEGGLTAGIPTRLWWKARLLFHWHTGERKGAVDQLRMEWVRLDAAPPVAVIPAFARKGRKKPGVYHLPPSLVEALRAIWQPVRELVFPFDRDPTMYWKIWNRLLKRAGLPLGPKSKTQGLRISHASWIKKLGGDPTQALLHSDPMTTAKHYLDASMEEPPPPLFDP